MTKRQEKGRGRHVDPLTRAMRRELAQARAIIRRVSGSAQGRTPPAPDDRRRWWHDDHATSPVTR